MKTPRQKQGDREADGKRCACPEARRARGVHVADRGVRVDRGDHERRCHEVDGEHAAGDEEVLRVAFHLAPDVHADEQGQKHGDPDAEQKHCVHRVAPNFLREGVRGLTGETGLYLGDAFGMPRLHLREELVDLVFYLGRFGGADSRARRRAPGGCLPETRGSQRSARA